MLKFVYIIIFITALLVTRSLLLDLHVNMTGSSSPKQESGKIPGIVFFSSIPTGMNVATLTEELQHFGQIGRVYLVPNKNSRGKSHRQYSEGWVEFTNRKNAKRLVKALNCIEVPGGKVVCFVYRISRENHGLVSFGMFNFSQKLLGVICSRLNIGMRNKDGFKRIAILLLPKEMHGFLKAALTRTS